ncbi:MAG: amidohydrolase family protein [Anaerolineaceae bacterium]|nr:amidohydrolase family protein [Anaerolineaceae bacterium]
MSQFSKPPIARYQGPMIDAHLHIRTAAETRLFVRMAESYGVRTFLGNGDLEFISDCRKAFAGRVYGLLRIRFEDVDRGEHFRRRTLDLLRRSVEEEDVRGAKFWFKPMFNASSGLYWDDPRLDHIFDFLVEHRMMALVHIGDPDIWWRHTYGNIARYGSKADAYRQLEQRMKRHPELLVQAAHLGGHPEDLGHLEQLLADYPRLYLDLSATKWLARELSREPIASREFIIRHADRILWGSDLVVGRKSGMTFDDYATRYYVHRHLWEGRGKLLSPIEDTDADRPVEVEGLDLPLEVLEKVYRRNAERLYRISVDR